MNGRPGNSMSSPSTLIRARSTASPSPKNRKPPETSGWSSPGKIQFSVTSETLRETRYSLPIITIGRSAISSPTKPYPSPVVKLRSRPP